MQKLALYCFDVLKYVADMLDTQSWKGLLMTSKCFSGLKDRPSLNKRAHPLCYLIKNLLPELLTKGLIGCVPLGYLADKMCKCLFTQDTINTYARCSPKYSEVTLEAFLSSPHMTIELFKSTWLSLKPKIEPLGANPSLTQEDLYSCLSNKGKQITPLTLHLLHPPWLHLVYGMVKSKKIKQSGPEFDLSFGYIREMVASTYELGPDLLRDLKAYNVQTSLLSNPYLTFEELIKEPFSEFDYNWNNVAYLPQLTFEDIKRNPEYPWPKRVEGITLNNSIRNSLDLPKDADFLSILREVYKQGIDRLSLRVRGLYLLAGTKVTFQEVLNTAYSFSKKGRSYHPYCITKHPGFDLATYFNSPYHLERVCAPIPGLGITHLNPDFPLRNGEEWALYMEKTEVHCASLAYSKNHYITPSVVRKYLLIKWSMLDLLLTPNQVNMFDIVELYKEGLLTLAWPF